MKLFYYPETDSLYIDLSERASMDSIEIAPGVVADVDEQGNVVGIDVDHASQRIQLDRLEISNLPARMRVASKG